MKHSKNSNARFYKRNIASVTSSDTNLDNSVSIEYLLCFETRRAFLSVWSRDASVRAADNVVKKRCPAAIVKRWEAHIIRSAGASQAQQLGLRAVRKFQDRKLRLVLDT